MDEKLGSPPVGKNTKTKPNSPTALTFEAARAIESGLSEPTFRGVSIGAALGKLLSIEMNQDIKRWQSPPKWIKKWLRYQVDTYKHRFTMPRNTVSVKNLDSYILFGWVRDREDFSRFLQPVIGSLGAERCFVFSASESVRAAKPQGTAFVNVRHLPFDSALWWHDYRTVSVEWKRRLRKVLKAHHLPVEFSAYLNTYIVFYTQMIARFDDLFQRSRPKAIVTEYDRDGINACLVLTAKRYEVPTFTMVHGVISPPSVVHAPLLADVAFCWGQQHHDQFVSMGTAPERLVITGRQNFSATLDAGAAEARSRLPVDSTVPLITLATNTIQLQQRLRMARIFCEAISQTTTFAGCIRLHPAENRQDYQTIAEQFPHIPITDKNDFSVDEALAMSSVVVCHDTGLGPEALLKGRLAVILNVVDVPLGNAKVLIQKAKCPEVGSATELLQTLERIHNNHHYRQELLEAAEQFVGYQYAALGAEAVANTVQAIESRIRRGSP